MAAIFRSMVPMRSFDRSEPLVLDRGMLIEIQHDNVSIILEGES